MNQMNTFITAFPDALVFFTMTILSLILLILPLRKNRDGNILSANPKLPSGLFILLSLQCVMLVVNVIGWISSAENVSLIILLDRWFITLSVIWLQWVLIPIKKRLSLILAGAASLLVSFIVLIAFFLMLATPYFSEINFAYVALFTSIITLVSLSASLVIMIIKRPSQYMLIALILIVQIIAYVIQLIFAFSMTLPVWLRLGQWLTISLLSLMVCNLIRNITRFPDLYESSSTTPSITPRIASTFMELSLQNSSQKLLSGLTHALSLYTMSDICGIVELNLEESKLNVHHVYDLFLEDYLQEFELTFEQVPQLSQSFLNHRSLSINDPASRDLTSIFTATQFNQLGEVTLLPLKFNGHAVNQALLFLMPYTLRHINPAILSDLNKITPTILRLFTQANELDNQKTATDSLLIGLNQVTSQKNDLQQNFDRSQSLLTELRNKYADDKASHQQEVQQLIDHQHTLEDELSSLKEIAERSSTALDQLDKLSHEKANLEIALTECNKNNKSLKNALVSAKSLIDASIIGNTPQTTDVFVDDLSDKVTEIQASQKRLGNVIRDVKIELTPFLELKELQLTIANNINKEIFISNAEQTQALVTSLLQNAIKASPYQQSIFFELTLEQQENKEPVIIMQVTDMGGGLSKSEQVNFFALIDRKGKPVPGGIGDAEAIRRVIHMVKQLNGNLWLKSGADQPTTFKIRLPLGIPPVQFEGLDG